ncbi:MAG: hypothetical protein GY799_17825 [Desulfobulbaceae bacterium]|nr:hypothetical protein [Desulfobulbaceae bacterium]
MFDFFFKEFVEGQMVNVWHLIKKVSFTRNLALVIAVFACLTAGCGSQLIYSNLNWLIPWYLEDYLPMTSAQEDRLQKDLEEILHWHCHAELIRYVDFLRESASWFKESKDIDATLIESKAEKIRQFYRDLVVRTGPDLAKLLQAASEEQIDTLFVNLEKENRELLHKYVRQSPQERSERRQARMKRLLRKWIGDLTAEQLLVINIWSQQLDVSFTVWIDNRRHVQERFRNFIARDRFLQDFAETLTVMLTRTEQLFTADYRVVSRQRSEITYRLLAMVGSTMTERQRQRLVDKLVDLADDLDSLRCI